MRVVRTPKGLTGKSIREAWIRSRRRLKEQAMFCDFYWRSVLAELGLVGDESDEDIILAVSSDVDRAEAWVEQLELFELGPLAEAVSMLVIANLDILDVTDTEHRCRHICRAASRKMDRSIRRKSFGMLPPGLAIGGLGAYGIHTPPRSKLN